MYKKTDYRFYLVSCFVGGFTLGITIGFWFTPVIVMVLLIAFFIGTAAALVYLCALLFKT